MAGYKIRQERHRFPVNPALGELAFFLHVDQPRGAQLLDVMGNGRRNDLETFAEVAHTFTHLFIEAAQSPWRAARHQVQEDGKSIGIG